MAKPRAYLAGWGALVLLLLACEKAPVTGESVRSRQPNPVHHVYPAAHRHGRRTFAGGAHGLPEAAIGAQTQATGDRVYD